MASIGERTSLKVLKEQSFGVFLDGGELGEILLPRKEVPQGTYTGDSIEVFIYTDSEDRPIATTMRPLAMPGQFAKLKCVDVNSYGAFLDWGLAKDIMVPFREQPTRMRAGLSYVVYLRVDPVTDRVVASGRLQKALKDGRDGYRPGQKVELMVYGKSDLGYNAIINGEHGGLLFSEGVYQDLYPGDTTTGYIQEVREDGKVTLSLHPQRDQRVSTLEGQILGELKANGGKWHLCDKSSPEDIHDALGVSKRTFKQALGALLKKGKIKITGGGIRKV